MAVQSDVYPRIMRLIRDRAEAVSLFEEQATAAARADSQYDAARQSIKMKKRLLDNVRTNAEAETWADVDPDVAELNTERKVMAERARATKLRVENYDYEIRVLHTMLVKEREADRIESQYGEG